MAQRIPDQKANFGSVFTDAHGWISLLLLISAGGAWYLIYVAWDRLADWLKVIAVIFAAAISIGYLIQLQFALQQKGKKFGALRSSILLFGLVGIVFVTVIACFVLLEEPDSFLKLLVLTEVSLGVTILIIVNIWETQSVPLSLSITIAQSALSVFLILAFFGASKDPEAPSKFARSVGIDIKDDDDKK